MPGIAGNADAAVNAFTLMKVIGRDIWIGVWAFVLSIIASTRWQSQGAQKASAAQIWQRFPKFVIGFLLASLIITLIARGFSYADYRKLVQPSLVTPLQSLRVWAFTTGVVVNVVLGFVLSTQVFVDFWTRLGQ
ncbi:MAG TPA: hypothetical protein VHW25_18120 [Steroidobacteraceae bacterium]|nr:hypothetical protein [Steroidobacteraceae bacterium]